MERYDDGRRNSDMTLLKEKKVVVTTYDVTADDIIFTKLLTEV